MAGEGGGGGYRVPTVLVLGIPSFNFQQLIELCQHHLTNGCDVEPLLLARAQQSVDTIALRGLRALLAAVAAPPCCQLFLASLVTVSCKYWRGAGLIHHNTLLAGPCITYNA